MVGQKAGRRVPNPFRPNADLKLPPLRQIHDGRKQEGERMNVLGRIAIGFLAFLWFGAAIGAGVSITHFIIKFW